MDEVYLVYDDLHGLQGVYGTILGAETLVKEIAFNQYDLPKDTPLDYDNENKWGWDGASWWKREVVI